MTHAPSRLRLAVLYGGRSAEHDVSIMSATNVVAALSPERYDILPIYVTRTGQWLESRFENGRLERPKNGKQLALLPGGEGRLISLGHDGVLRLDGKIDLLFPVMHGLGGEDGTIQGCAEVAGVPLVGCGVMGSAAAIDKDMAKRLLDQAGLPTARGVVIHKGAAPSFDALVRELGLPLFVKPARQGSSVGVSKVRDAAGYAAALKEGFGCDDKLLAEEFVEAREIEFAVLESPRGELFVSRAGEIAPAQAHGFYSYDAKYVDAQGAAVIVPAQLPAEVETLLRERAGEAFRALGCDGMARVDFFLRKDMSFVVNELNTIPGFTDISMYPKAMAASGIDYPTLIDRLVAHALARAGRDDLARAAA